MFGLLTALSQKSAVMDTSTSVVVARWQQIGWSIYRHTTGGAVSTRWATTGAF